MVKVPEPEELGLGRVQPQAAQTPYMNIRPPKSHAGAQLKELGGALGSLGGALTASRDKASMYEAQRFIDQQTVDLNAPGGIMQARGRDANGMANRLSSHYEKVGKDLEKIIAGASPDTAAAIRQSYNASARANYVKTAGKEIRENYANAENDRVAKLDLTTNKAIAERNDTAAVDAYAKSVYENTYHHLYSDEDGARSSDVTAKTLATEARNNVYLSVGAALVGEGKAIEAQRLIKDKVGDGKLKSEFLSKIHTAVKKQQSWNLTRQMVQHRSNGVQGVPRTRSNLPTKVQSAIQNSTRRNFIPAGHLDAIIALESGGRNIQNLAGGSAAGVGQIMPATAKHLGVSNVWDIDQNVEGVAKLYNQNKKVLSSALGREPTIGEMYLAHQQGGGGARALLQNPNMSAVDALAKAYGGNRSKAQKKILANGGNTNQTAGEFARMWMGKAENAYSGGELSRQFGQLGRGVHIQFNMGPRRPYPPNAPIMRIVAATTEAVLGAGARVVVVSGQEGGNKQHGSARHKTGSAADVQFYKADGTRVTASTHPQLFKQIHAQAVAFGAKAAGWGAEYMGGNSMHIDLVGTSLGGGTAWGSGATSNDLLGSANAQNPLSVNVGARYGSLQDRMVSPFDLQGLGYETDDPSVEVSVPAAQAQLVHPNAAILAGADPEVATMALENLTKYNKEMSELQGQQAQKLLSALKKKINEDPNWNSGLLTENEREVLFSRATDNHSFYDLLRTYEKNVRGGEFVVPNSNFDKVVTSALFDPQAFIKRHEAEGGWSEVWRGILPKEDFDTIKSKVESYYVKMGEGRMEKSAKDIENVDIASADFDTVHDRFSPRYNALVGTGTGDTMTTAEKARMSMRILQMVKNREAARVTNKSLPPLNLEQAFQLAQQDRAVSIGTSMFGDDARRVSEAVHVMKTEGWSLTKLATEAADGDLTISYTTRDGIPFNVTFPEGAVSNTHAQMQKNYPTSRFIPAWQVYETMASQDGETVLRALEERYGTDWMVGQGLPVNPVAKPVEGSDPINPDETTDAIQSEATGLPVSGAELFESEDDKLAAAPEGPPAPAATEPEYVSPEDAMIAAASAEPEQVHVRDAETGEGVTIPDRQQEAVKNGLPAEDASVLSSVTGGGIQIPEGSPYKSMVGETGTPVEKMGSAELFETLDKWVKQQGGIASEDGAPTDTQSFPTSQAQKIVDEAPFMEAIRAAAEDDPDMRAAMQQMDAEAAEAEALRVEIEEIEKSAMPESQKRALVDSARAEAAAREASVSSTRNSLLVAVNALKAEARHTLQRD